MLIKSVGIKKVAYSDEHGNIVVERARDMSIADSYVSNGAKNAALQLKPHSSLRRYISPSRIKKL